MKTEQQIIAEAECYATSMQGNNVTDNQLWVESVDIYLSVANWQNSIQIKHSGIMGKLKSKLEIL